jgi:hypothetical protein
MRYIEPLVGFGFFLWFTLASWLAARSLRKWQERAQIILGLSGMALFGLRFYGESLYSNTFNLLKVFLAGITLGIFITLWLEGSLNVLSRLKRRDGTARTNQERP